MKKIIKNYKQSIILIGSLVIGTIVGLGLIYKNTAVSNHENITNQSQYYRLL